MKYVKIAIMAVLIFSVAVSPVFSNGLAFAQESTDKTEKEKKEQRSEESKQKKAEQTAKAEERTQTSKEKKEISKEKHVEDSEAKQEKRTAAQELQEQRKAELAERNRLLMERLAEQERIDRERMQERMEDRSPMTDAMNMLTDAGVIEPTSEPEEQNELPEPTKSLTTKNEVNIPFDKTSKYFDKLRETITQYKIQQEVILTQMNILMNLVDSMCEDKVLVVGVHDGNYRCIEHDTAIKLKNRGTITLVE